MGPFSARVTGRGIALQVLLSYMPSGTPTNAAEPT